jgi:hypothetical protein
VRSEASDRGHKIHRPTTLNFSVVSKTRIVSAAMWCEIPNVPVYSCFILLYKAIVPKAKANAVRDDSHFTRLIKQRHLGSTSIMGSMAEQAAIPTVDISAMLSPTASDQERQVVITSMSDACHTYGFFNLVGHGVPQMSLRDALACNKLFFSLPEEKKMEVSIDKSIGRSFRGYEPPGIQTHHAGLLPDTKEVSVFIGRTLTQYLVREG